MRLLIRADASRREGAGHLIRGLSLAQSARALGHDVSLCGSSGDIRWLGETLAHERLAVLAPPPWQELAERAAAAGFDAVHVDSYAAPHDLADSFDRCQTVLSSIQDGPWGRRPAHVVTDPSFNAEARGDVLAGPAYLLLRTEVRRGRLAAAERAPRPTGAPLVVVVVLGGTDASDALPGVLDVLASAGRSARVPLHVRAVTAALRPLPRHDEGWTAEAVAPGQDLVRSMAAADLVVTAAGTTTGEVCCLGVAMATLPVVENQVPGYKQLVLSGLAFGLGPRSGPGLGPDATEVLAHALRDGDARQAAADLAARTVDGSGAARLVRAIELATGRTPPEAPDLHVRRAGPADSAAQLAWRNDPLVRRSSQAPGPVDDEGHARWFDDVLRSPTRHLFVVEDDAVQPIASVRWDALDHARSQWEVSIMLAPHHRGRGWGAAILAAAEERLLADEPSARSLSASVAAANAASRSLFQRSGYLPAGPARTPGFDRLSKRVRADPS